MTLQIWEPRQQIEIDPNARKDFYFDLTPWLAANPDIPGDVADTISSYDFFYDDLETPAVATKITGQVNDDKAIYYWVQGVTEFQVITARVTTDKGRIIDVSNTWVPTET